MGDQFAYLRTLHDFYGDGAVLSFVEPFQRRSAFHDFIEFNIDLIVGDETTSIDLKQRKNIYKEHQARPYAFNDLTPTLFPINQAMRCYSIPHDTFEVWLKDRQKSFLQATDDDLSEYYSDLRSEEAYEQLLDRAVGEVFFLLFPNRHLLMVFNEMMANQVTSVDNLAEIPAENRVFFRRHGILKRASIPYWVKKAVYFRYRGHCCLCLCDLSGLRSLTETENYDHTVPLAQGGLNDVTNIQLLCKRCNHKKSSRDAVTSNLYEVWYPLT